MPPADGTVFQKVLQQPHFDTDPVTGELQISFDGTAGKMMAENASTIGGSVTVASDTANLATVAEIDRGLRLDYQGTSFSPNDKSVFALRFKVEDADISSSLHSSMGGSGRSDQWSDPYTGNGFTKAADNIIPEYLLGKADVQEGAEIWEILSDGSQRLTAVFRNDKWLAEVHI